MNKPLKSLLLLSLLSLAALFSVSCVAVAVGAAAGGTVAYVRGDLQVTYDASIDDVQNAAVAAVKELGFSLISDRGDRTGGEVVARTSEDRRIQITIKPAGDNLTEARIRVGTFGDQDLSLRINEAMRRRL